MKYYPKGMQMAYTEEGTPRASTYATGGDLKAETKKDTQVEAELTRLRGEVSSIVSVLNTLEARLANILVDAPPEPDKEGHPEPLRVALAQVIYEQNYVLAAQVERVIQMTGRLEL